MAYIISVINQKGGVGKTTTVCNLAAGLTQLGKKVLAVDLDDQMNLTDYLGCTAPGQSISDLVYAQVAQGSVDVASCIRTNAEGVAYVPASKMLASAPSIMSSDSDSCTVLRRIFQHPSVAAYDFIILDCRPALDLTVVNALAASHGVIIPVQAEKFAVDGLSSLLETVERTRRVQNPQLAILGILITMYDARTNMSKEVDRHLRDSFGHTVFETVIPRMVEATISTNDCRSLVGIKNSRLGQRYLEMAQEVIEKTQGKDEGTHEFKNPA